MKEGKLVINNFRFIVLLIGRADLWQSDKEFRSSVGMCLETIRGRNEDAVIVLCATIPFPDDSRRNIKIIGDRNTYLSVLAGEDSKLQFAKPGKGLFVYGGPSKAFYNEFSKLNAAGLELVRFGLENKFRCANLRSRNS